LIQSTIQDTIKEEIIMKTSLTDKPIIIQDHSKMCRCIDCRKYFQENLTLCNNVGCGYEPFRQCIKGFCYNHCIKYCGNEHE
jgi:hypothetical protein